MYDFNSIYRAKSVEDAINELEKNPESVIISGGSDVLIKIREGKLSGCSLVSINDIPDLKGIFMDKNESIVIKPATNFTSITNNPIIQKYIPVLGESVDQIGGPQIRNVGTIGGNICNGVTSADSASTLFTLNAKLEITGKDKKRIIPIKDFYIGAGKVDLKPSEILTAIIIEKENYKNHYGYYIKYAMRNAMDIATLGCAVLCELSDDKKGLKDLRLAYGVAGPVPMRCLKTEELLKGQVISEELFKRLSESAKSEVNPRTSWRASKEFRMQLVGELCIRALKKSIIRAGGKISD